jgi:hypothetical protein
MRGKVSGLAAMRGGGGDVGAAEQAVVRIKKIKANEMAFFIVNIIRALALRFAQDGYVNKVGN